MCILDFSDILLPDSLFTLLFSIFIDRFYCPSMIFISSLFHFISTLTSSLYHSLPFFFFFADASLHPRLSQAVTASFKSTHSSCLPQTCLPSVFLHSYAIISYVASLNSSALITSLASSITLVELGCFQRRLPFFLSTLSQRVRAFRFLSIIKCSISFFFC